MPAASAIKVMVVDDQTSMRAMIRRSLQDLGFKDIRDKGDAAEALADIKADRVHLVISDYNMPDMDGLQLLHSLRTGGNTASIGFLLITGRADKEIVDKGRRLGMNNLVRKPFDTAGLKQAIEAIVGRI